MSLSSGDSLLVSKGLVSLRDLIYPSSYVRDPSGSIDLSFRLPIPESSVVESRET